MADVLYVAAFDDRSLYLWIVVSFVEAEVLWSPRRRLRPTGDYAAQGYGCGFFIHLTGVEEADAFRGVSVMAAFLEVIIADFEVFAAGLVNVDFLYVVLFGDLSRARPTTRREQMERTHKTKCVQNESMNASHLSIV